MAVGMDKWHMTRFIVAHEGDRLAVRRTHGRSTEHSSDWLITRARQTRCAGVGEAGWC
jgi:hypothetical protein